MPRASRRLSYRVKGGIVLLGGLPTLLACDIVYEASRTLKQLDIVEAERDGWQKPADILQSLELKPGYTVIDLGCGSGYFTLKLSRTVGEHGKVLAVDIRRLPLAFLWVRTWLKANHNVRIVTGEPDDPHLGEAIADGVLIVNTYHELQHPGTILNHSFRALVPGGRLVIADRSADASAGHHDAHHQVSAAGVEDEVRGAGFRIVQRIDRLVDNPQNGEWWLLAARKP